PAIAIPPSVTAPTSNGPTRSRATNLKTRRRRAAIFRTLSAARLWARHAPAHPHLGLPARVQRCGYRGTILRIFQALHRSHRLLAALSRAKRLRRAGQRLHAGG